MFAQLNYSKCFLKYICNLFIRLREKINEVIASDINRLKREKQIQYNTNYSPNGRRENENNHLILQMPNEKFFVHSNKQTAL